MFGGARCLRGGLEKAKGMEMKPKVPRGRHLDIPVLHGHVGQRPPAVGGGRQGGGEGRYPPPFPIVEGKSPSFPHLSVRSISQSRTMSL